MIVDLKPLCYRTTDLYQHHLFIDKSGDNMTSLTNENIILLTVTLVIGWICGWLTARLQAQQRLQQALKNEQHERENLLQQLARLEAQLEAERRSGAEKLQLLNETQQQLEQKFRALSSQALVANNQNFLELAKSTLENFHQQAQGDLETRHQAINQLVQPLQESLHKVDQKIEQLEQKRSGAYARLDEQLKSLLNSQLKLESETGNLVRALRTPAVRGRWGEIQLRKVVEMAGMVNYCDFVEQETADSGRLRPDMVIKLPNGRNIIVDSKAPLQAYLESLEADNDQQRTAHLAHHAR
jgi:DNA recombination protein RmuC